MSDGHSDTRHIFQSLFTNAAIAAIKGAAAVFTGSGAMLAEAIHSSSDCANQILLLLGVKRSAKRADASHPLGYGRALYFWSFLVALLLFTGGGVFSIYEGLEKVTHPEALEHVEIALGILLVSLVLEGWSTWGNVKEMNKRRGSVPFFRYLKETKDSDLIVVFGENAAASGGLTFAIIALALAWGTGDTRWDGVGSLAVGVVLVAVAIFLAVEVQSLLLGERADPNIEAAIRAVAAKHATIEKIYNLITIQQGPGEVLVAIKIKFVNQSSGDALVDAINAFERDIRQERPEIRWSFVEPDTHD
jgi:cation diffusion facilitator family transporter